MNGLKSLKMATITQYEERARELILQNRRVTINEIAKQLTISITSAYSVVRGNLQFHKMCAKDLTDEHKCMCFDICSRHLARYCEEGDNLLIWIVTGDDTWIHHYEPETRLVQHEAEAPVICCKEILDATISR
jgi:hypothetical protein